MKFKIHPIAALFPMMSQDELEELTADIKANGLQQPIIVDKDNVLIDGRNRLEACNRLGIEPKIETVDGQDIVLFILSANIQRRHLSKGQIAMIVAKTRKFETNTTTKKRVASLANLSEARIKFANTVLEYAPELVDGIIAGNSPKLDEAYAIAVDRRAAEQTTAKQLETLQAEAPDLIDLVRDERLKLSEAIGTLRQRKEEEKKHRAVTTRLFGEAVLFLDPKSNTPAELADHIFGAIDPDIATVDLTKEHLKNALEVFKLIIAKLIKKYEQINRSTKSGD